MKEKKTIACVVLGVAFVSLISVLVAAFANSLVMFIDGNRIRGVSVFDKYAIMTGSITLGAVVLGIAFVVLFFVNIKRRFAVNLSLLVVIAVYIIATAVVLRTQVGRNGDGELSTNAYSAFTSYLTSAITIAVSAALMFCSRLYLLKTNQSEPPKTE